MTKKEKRNQSNHLFMQIPFKVFYDQNLKHISKLLIGQLIWLSQKHGYCFATNESLANMMSTSRKTIVDSIKELRENNYIIIKKGIKRNIYINYETINKFNFSEHTKSILERIKNEPAEGQKLPSPRAENDPYIKSSHKEESIKNNNKEETRTDRSHLPSSDKSDNTNKDIVSVIITDKKYFVDRMLEILDVIKESNSKFNYIDFIQFLVLETKRYKEEDNIAEYTKLDFVDFSLNVYQSLVDSYYRSMEHQGVGFSADDPEVRKRVEDFYKFLNELIVD